MSTLIRCIMTALFVTVMFSSPLHQASAQVAVTKIAVIDMKAVFDESTRFQQIARQYEASYMSRAEQLRQREEALKRDLADLQTKSSMMEEEAFIQRRNELRMQYVELERMMMENLQELNLEKEEALLPVIEELKTIVETIAAEEGIAVVLNKRYLVFVDDSADITHKVLQRLNR